MNTTYLLPAEPEPIVCDSIADVVKEFYELCNREMLKLEAAEAENLRVRGLLQRQSDALESWLQVFHPVEGMGLAPLDYGLKEDVVRLVKQSRKALSQGAESADIGRQCG